MLTIITGSLGRTRSRNPVIVIPRIVIWIIVYRFVHFLIISVIFPGWIVKVIVDIVIVKVVAFFGRSRPTFRILNGFFIVLVFKRPIIIWALVTDVALLLMFPGFRISWRGSLGPCMQFIPFRNLWLIFGDNSLSQYYFFLEDNPVLNNNPPLYTFWSYHRNIRLLDKWPLPMSCHCKTRTSSPSNHSTGASLG